MNKDQIRDRLTALFTGATIRVISHNTNQIFTVRPTADKPRSMAEILNYAEYNMHEGLEGVVSDVKHLAKMEFTDLIREQNNPKYTFALFVSRISSYLIHSETGTRVWES